MRRLITFRNRIKQRGHWFKLKSEAQVFNETITTIHTKYIYSCRYNTWLCRSYLHKTWDYFTWVHYLHKTWQITLPEFTIYIKHDRLLYLSSPRVVGVAHLYRFFLCCPTSIVLCFCFVFSSSCVAYVAGFSGLYIFYCPFGIL